MNKSAKIILIILAILILLPVVAVIGAKIYFTSDRLKAMIMPKIEEQIGREVAVDHIALKIFPNLRVDLTGLEISNPPNQEFTVNTFLRLEELTVDVQLRPLLKKQLKIDEISLIRPEIYLEVKADGTNNYTFDLQDAEPEGTETVDDTTAAQAMSMFIPALNMSGATLEYLNYQSDQHLLIEELNNQVAIAITNGGDNIVFESQMSTEGLSYGSTKSFLISKLPLSVYQEVTFKGAEDKLYLDSVQVAIREIALDLSGTVSSVRTNPLLDLSLNSSKADIEQLLSLVPEEFMKASQGITTKGSFQFAMTIKGEAGEKKQPEIKGSFDVSEGTIQYPGLPKAISDVNVKGRFGQSFNGERYEGSLLVDPFSAVLGQNKVYGKISVRDFNDPHLGVSLKGNINLNEIKDYYPLPEGLTVSGMMIADASVNGKTADPKSIRASGKIDIQKVTVTSATMAKPIENLDGIVTFSNQVIKASNFTMKIGKSDLKMTFNLENYLGLAMPEFASQGKPYATMTLTSNNLYMDDLVSEPKEGEKAGSKSEAKKSGSMLPPINADIGASIGKLVAEDFVFTNVKGKVKLREGVLDLENLSLNTFNGSVVTKGTVDLRHADRTPFDLTLDMKSMDAHAMLPQFTSFGSQVFGNFSMSGKMTGALNDTMGLDPTSLNGGGNLNVLDGRIVGYPATTALASFTGISELKEMAFSNWNGQMKIQNGRIIFDPTNIKSKQNDFILSGSQGFDGSLDLDLRVRVPESQFNQLKIQGFAAELVQFLKDDEGKINLDFDIGGTYKSPKLSLDQKPLQDAAKAALEAKAQEELNKLEDEAKDKIEDALKDLFGK